MPDFDEFRRAVASVQPRTALVLGSGQSQVVQTLQTTASIEFHRVPGLYAPSVVGHSGKILCGTLAGTALLVFQGRLHRYEGWSTDAIVAPLRLAAGLGIENVLLTNAAGAISAALAPGSIMIVRDHLDWQSSPLGAIAGPANRGPPYSPRLNGLLQQAGALCGEPLLYSGVYAAVTGPCYETPAEIRALRAVGADAVGMSTAPEAMIAQSMGLECAALSAMANKAAGIEQAPLDHGDVLRVMATIQGRLHAIIAAYLQLLASDPDGNIR